MLHRAVPLSYVYPEQRHGLVLQACTRPGKILRLS